MRAKFGQTGTVDGLPKIDKYFITIPSCRPIAVTTEVNRYNVGKYSLNLVLIKSSHTNLLYN